MPKIKILLFILLSSIGAAAQLQRYDNFAATTTSTAGVSQISVIANATITVFNYPGAGASCAGGGCTAATTYTSRTGLTTCATNVPLTRPTAITCIATADSQGNFGFWAFAGVYQYCVTAASFSTQCFNVVLGPTLDGNNVFTGSAPAMSVNNVGAFSAPTANVDYLLANVGSCSDTTIQTGLQGAGKFALSPLVGCLKVPSGISSPPQGAFAFLGAVDDESGGTIPNTVAVEGIGFVGASNGHAWGANLAVYDKSGITTTTEGLFGTEVDVQPQNAPNYGSVVGVLSVFLSPSASWTGSTGANYAFSAVSGASGQNGGGQPGAWQGAYQSADGCCGQFLSIGASKQITGANTGNSQNIQFRSVNNGVLVHNDTALFQDNSGNLTVQTLASAGLRVVNAGNTRELFDVFNDGGVQFSENTAPGAVAGKDVCYGDSTAHALKCSYNNASFFNQTQTIGTGNVTTAGTAINTLTCQAQTGITVTGAATTDNVLANIGVALPATWQTGIVLSAHVTATNTVTVYLCNPTATASITPAATQVNVRVLR